MSNIETNIREIRVKDAVYHLIKISDDRFEGNHPNGINVGIALGNLTQYLYPEVGTRPTFLSHGRWLRTSEVTEVVSETNTEIIFKTVNSTYAIRKMR